MGSRIRIAMAALLCAAPSAWAAGQGSTAGLTKGTPHLKSAGTLAFGPDGLLFVGDSQGATLFAIETGDRTPASGGAAINIEGVNTKIADLLGTKPQSIMINDVAVNPASGNVYLSVSRGRGPDATPVLLRVGKDGKIEEFSLQNVMFAKTEIPNAPAAGAAGGRGPSPRSESVTDLAYVDGRVFLAGLSNEEFSSRLLAIPYPFTNDTDGAAIEIYHGAHGRFETRSPVRTFVSYKIQGEPFLLAAYTCTPLVKVPVADLKAGAHVKGKTIAELGNRNRPIDMVVYQKDGKDYLLMANSSRGVMKIPTEGADHAESITSPVPGGGTKGLGYETIKELKGVEQLDMLDKTHAVILVRKDGGSLNLETIELP